MDDSRNYSARRSGEAGFTLTEVLVASFVLVVVLAGVLALLELNTDLARAQTQLADLQQSIRVAQTEMMSDVRMAGRGGLPRGALPDGVAVAVRNNVPGTGDESFIAVGDSDSPVVVQGSDVLTLRGVFSTPVYQIDTLAGNLVLDDLTTPTQGTIRIQDPIANVGVPQNLQPLIDAEDGDALLLVSPLGGFAVVAVDSSAPNHSTSDAKDVRLGFTIGTVGGTEQADLYAALSNGFPPDLRSVAHVGLLEEYRYFVRERFAVSGDSDSDLTPTLARARFLPGTELAHPSDPNLGEDVSDNVFDLQIALGVDTDNDEIVEEDGTGADDWLFNTRDDLDGAGNPQNLPMWNGAGGSPPSLYYVRLTTLARTDRRDPNYEAPLLTTIEDKDYGVAPFNEFNTRTERMFRRRLLRTVVDLRNLS